MPEYNVGIDLGTTYSCIAHVDELGNAKVVKNFEEEDTTPSVILFQDEGGILVGSTAKDQSLFNSPNNTVSAIKREMGTSNSREIMGKSYSPTELSAMILKKIIFDFNQKMNTDVKKAVITVPAYFGDPEREATRQAGLIAGLTDVRIISEPTAAAISYGVDQEGSKNVLVYDLGGGTFDITVLKIEEKALTPLCTEGDKLLGGKDWDVALAELIKQKIEEGFSVSVDEINANDQARNEIMLNAEKHKKTLSRSEQAKGALAIGANRVTYIVTKEEFESATAHLLAKTLEIMDKAMEVSKLSIGQISDILLVGGSSKMPQVETAMKAKYPNSSIKLYDPDFAVARGAALYAMSGAFDEATSAQVTGGASALGGSTGGVPSIGGKHGEVGGRTIRHILGKTFGLEVRAGDKQRISNIIYRNKPLPLSNTGSYRPLENNQENVFVRVYESDCLEGEKEVNLEMGTVVGEKELPLPSGVTTNDEIKVTFSVGEDGILLVLLECKGLKKDYTLERAVSMSKEEMEAAKEKVNGLVLG